MRFRPQLVDARWLRRGWWLIALIVLAATVPASARAADRDRDFAVGHVYVLNNNLASPNSISVFARAADGALHAEGSVPIGGTGNLAAFADGTQGSLIRTSDGSRLFAVDAGSDQISVLDVDDGRLRLVGVFPSGGAGPVSLTYQGGLLYVLNAANASPAAANVAGFRVDARGRLHPIAGATQPLSTAHPNPAQVQLSPDGRELVVTEKGTNLIDLYRVARDGSLSGPTTAPSIGETPFGMAFDPANEHELVVADAGKPPAFQGAATAYRLGGSQLRLINGPVPDFQIAPCWMVISRDGRFAYTANADSQAISGYRIHPNGTISLLDPNGATATTPSDTFPLEEAITRDNRFLDVLDSRLLLPTGPGPATISGFTIEENGHLRPVVDPASINLPFSAIGLTAI